MKKVLSEAKEEKPEVLSENKEIQKEDYKSQFLRSVADLENFRKRVAKEKQEIIKMANASLIESLLPVIDNIKLGLNAAENHSDSKDIKKGFEMVLNQINKVLEEKGLHEISPNEKAFDPNKHESIASQPSENIPEGHIIETIRTGYLLNERLIRAANVIVSSGNPEIN